MGKKQSRLWLWVGLLILVALVSQIAYNPGVLVPFFDDQPYDAPTVILPEGYEEHLLLQAKGRGPCKELEGDVLLTVVFVDDKQASWTDEAKKTTKAAHQEATNKLLAEAKNYGAQLDLSFQYLSCAIQEDPVIITDYQDWTNAALQACGLPDKSAVDAHLKNKHQVDAAPILFYVNYTGRSFALQQESEGNCEYAIFFSNAHDYRHELYHLFGAEDYYFPSRVTTSAKALFPNSIMLVTEKDVVTDALTAYLIGWTDELSAEAKTLLDDTLSMTKEEIDTERKDSTFTGTKTKRYASGTYTGEFVAGLQHGHGKMVWDSGTVYEGEWVNGTIHGEGTIVWDSGITYTGEFADGELHGTGTMTYTDGRKRTGRWEKGKAVD